MSYTVGIKRKLWFGYRKVQVKGHDWQNGRFILNLTDGSQEHIPGFSAPVVRVYPDFWTHLAQIEHQRPAVPSMPVRQNMAPREPQFDIEEPVHVELPENPLDMEAKRRATERVRSLLASDGTH